MNFLQVFLLLTLCTFAYSTCIEERAKLQSNRYTHHPDGCVGSAIQSTTVIDTDGCYKFCKTNNCQYFQMVDTTCYTYNSGCIQYAGYLTYKITNQIGTFAPQCNEQTPEKYKPLQCHGSIGFCWCVDTDTGEKLSDIFHPWESDERCDDKG